MVRSRKVVAKRGMDGYIHSFSKAKTIIMYQYIYCPDAEMMFPLNMSVPPHSMLDGISATLGPYPPHPFPRVDDYNSLLGNSMIASFP